MPQTGGQISHSTAPALNISEPANLEKCIQRTAGTSNSGRRLRSEEPTTTKTYSRLDAYDARPRRRKKKRRVSTLSTGSSRSSRAPLRGTTEPLRKTPGSSGFFAGLGRILEVTESGANSRSSTRGSERGIYREEGPSRRLSHMDEASSSYRRSMKSTSRAGLSPTDGLPTISPSVLSVISGMTVSSDISSNSSSTITPESYIRRERSRAESTDRQRRVESELRASVTEQLPNVFDFMEFALGGSENDGESVVSSSSVSSHGRQSHAASSIAPETPSSQSTFPSASPPTATQHHSNIDLRTKYDQQCATESDRSYNNSPAPSLRSLRKQPTVSDVPEEDGETAPSEISYNRHRSSSRSSRRLSASHRELQQREESLRRHMETVHPTHYIEPTHSQQRSFSTSSSHSSHSHHHPQHESTQQIQHYQWPAPPPPHHLAHTNGHISPPIDHPPIIPDPPDLTRTTLTGYEHLALELASPTSSVQPLYRKFTYLNHRILLHLQDELAELEEHLRLLDEILAQHHQLPISPDGSPPTKEKKPTHFPASRRAEAAYGTDLHLNRRDLLGQIFVKTEQYNRALASFSAVANSGAAASEAQVRAYRGWMATFAPVHEVETRFLLRAEDLIAPVGMERGGLVGNKLVYACVSAAVVLVGVVLILPMGSVEKVVLFMAVVMTGVMLCWVMRG